MKKLKKIFTSFNLLVIGWLSKAFAFYSNDIEEPNDIDILYGIPSPTHSVRVLNKISYLSIFVFFIIGLFVAFNKKLSKKAKIITIIIFIAIVVSIKLITFFVKINYD